MLVFRAWICGPKGCEWRRPSETAKLPAEQVGAHTFDKAAPFGENTGMSKLEAIEDEVRRLPRKQAAQLQDWLADYLEDQAELNPEFVKSIERGNADLREGRARVRKG